MPPFRMTGLARDRPSLTMGHERGQAPMVVPSPAMSLVSGRDLDQLSATGFEDVAPILSAGAIVAPSVRDRRRAELLVSTTYWPMGLTYDGPGEPCPVLSARRASVFNFFVRMVKSSSSQYGLAQAVTVTLSNSVDRRSSSRPVLVVRLNLGTG